MWHFTYQQLGLPAAFQAVQGFLELENGIFLSQLQSPIVLDLSVVNIYLAWMHKLIRFWSCC